MKKEFIRCSLALTATIWLSFFSSQIVAQEKVFIVTGFEAFHGESMNPSWEAVQLLPDQIGNVRLIKLKLSVSYKKGFLPLQEAMNKFKPIGILATGVANISGYHVEQKAYNQDDDIWADNDNVVRRAWPSIPAPFIIQGAPPILESSNFPTDKILAALSAKGVLAKKSIDPSRFLCNHVFYLMLYELSQRGLKIPAGFIHVPPLSPGYNIAQNEIVLEESIRTLLNSLPASPIFERANRPSF